MAVFLLYYCFNCDEIRNIGVLNPCCAKQKSSPNFYLRLRDMQLSVKSKPTFFVDSVLCYIASIRDSAMCYIAQSHLYL
jgi:hypothetical protein